MLEASGQGEQGFGLAELAGASSSSGLLWWEQAGSHQHGLSLSADLVEPSLQGCPCFQLQQDVCFSFFLTELMESINKPQLTSSPSLMSLPVHTPTLCLTKNPLCTSLLHTHGVAAPIRLLCVPCCNPAPGGLTTVLLQLPHPTDARSSPLPTPGPELARRWGAAHGKWGPNQVCFPDKAQHGLWSL